MPEDKTYDSWLDAAENIPAGAIWRPHIVYQTDTSGWYWRDERDHCAEWAGSFATNEEAARAACAAHDFRPVVGQPQQDSPKGRPKPLHKTTIVIWTDYNADETEISDLAREAEVGDAYCSKRASTAVADPAKDPDWDDTEFFDSDTNSDADVEADAQHGDELPDDPIKKQKTEPVFLTSGICEDAEHLSPWDLQKLGLSFSVDTGGDPFDASQWDADNYGGDSDWYMKGYTFYPLTTAESKFVADDTFDTPEGLGIMGYSVVYQGRKWLYPAIEISYAGPDDDAKHGGFHYANEALAKAAADYLARQVREKLEAIGGDVHVYYNDGCDNRHTVHLRIPFEHACALGTFENYKAWLEGLFPAN